MNITIAFFDESALRRGLSYWSQVV